MSTGRDESEAVGSHPFVRALPVLRTQRLSLRPVEIADAPAIQRIYSDARVATMTDGFAHPYPEGEGERWVVRQRDALARGEGGALVVVEQQGGVLGHIGLRVEPVDYRAEVSYAIAPEWAGQGLASEALTVVVDWCFNEAGLHRLYALVYVTNTASIRVLEKMGFVREGRLRGHALHVDRFEDDLVYGLLREEWKGTT